MWIITNIFFVRILPTSSKIHFTFDLTVYYTQNIVWNKSPIAKLICFIFIETFYSNIIFLKEKMAIFMFVYLKSFNKTQMDIIFWSGCCVKSLLSTVVQILLLFSWGINSFLSMLCLWAVLSVRADVVDNQSDKSQKWVWKCRSNCQAGAEWQFPSHCPHPSHDQSLTAKKKCVIIWCYNPRNQS